MRQVVVRKVLWLMGISKFTFDCSRREGEFDNYQIRLGQISIKLYVVGTHAILIE